MALILATCARAGDLAKSDTASGRIVFLGAYVPALVLAVALPLGAQTSVRAQAARSRIAPTSERRVHAAHAGAGIRLDGRIDEPAWRRAGVARDFVQQRPTPGAVATERTEVRVLFDAGALYVGMRLEDRHADSLVASLGRRDYEGYADWAHVIIDSYRDRRTGFHFAITPAGTRRDGIITNDAEWQEDLSWDAIWDAVTSRDSLGWTAELRIPLTQLRFADCAPPATALADSAAVPLAGGSGCTWGIQFARDIARRNERSTWAPIPPNGSGYVSRFGSLDGLGGIRAPRRLDVVPYTLGRVTRAARDPANPFAGRTTPAGALGADIGVGVTSTLSLTATVNPDFGQVDADPSEVNLTGFETWQRERRPFFVEGAEIFRYPLGDGFFFGDEHLVYSRRIGRAPQLDDPDGAGAVDRPEATTILGAAKLSGRVGRWTLGILDAVTVAERGRYRTATEARRSFLAEPATNYAVARLVRDSEDGARGLGLIATAVHRDLDARAAETLHASALSGGVDARLRSASRNYAFSGNLLGSVVRGSPLAIVEAQRSSAHLFQRADWRGGGVDSTRTSLAGLSAELHAAKQGGGHLRWGASSRLTTRGFEVNDIGFQHRSDVVSAASWVGWSHFEPGRTVRRWDLWSNHWAQWGMHGGRERLTSNLFLHVDLQNNWSIVTELRRDYAQRSPTVLRGGPALYMPASVHGSARLASDMRHVVSGALAMQANRDDAGEGRRLALMPSLTMRPSARAELSLEPAVSWMRNPAQYVETIDAGADTSYLTAALTQRTASLAIRLNVTFTPRLSLQLYGAPFVSAGDYRDFAEVRDPRAVRLRDRVAAFGSSAVAPGDGDALRIDRGPGRVPAFIDDPDFGVRALQSNAVLRWEYRAGSALFLVWSQARDDDVGQSESSLARQVRGLWRTDATNVLLIKASYRLAR